MKKIKFSIVLISLLGLAGCKLPDKEEDKYRTPTMFISATAYSSDEPWKYETTTNDLINNYGWTDYIGNVRKHLKNITSYEQKDKIEEDKNYFVYKRGNSFDGQAMTVYENGYVDISSGYGGFGPVYHFYYHIDPEIAKSIHDSCDEEIRGYQEIIEKENEYTDSFDTASKYFSLMSEVNVNIKYYDKEKDQYSSAFYPDDNEAFVNYLSSFTYTNSSYFPNSKAKFSCRFAKYKQDVYYDFYDSFDLVSFSLRYDDELRIEHKKTIYCKINNEDGKKINDYLIDLYTTKLLETIK
ncbi:MAG: hypothetical protein K6E21_05445 [Bacilli bacterium]|nr:hypothetical protein [Bacilli bacterium]